MLDTIPNLWSAAELKPTVVSPVAILRAQANRLSQMTQGILDAEVTVLQGRENQIVLGLEIVVRSLDNYRHRLLSVEHNRDEIYPAIVTAQGLTITKTIKKAGIAFLPFEEETIKRDVDTKSAYSENEFVVILKEVLQAPQTIAMLQSLIARSNDITNTTETLEETDTDEDQEHK